MSEKRITDHEASDDSNGVADRQEVNRSRRRFTGAGLSASAILTLASRPAFASTCSTSGMLSGNVSRPGGDECAAMAPSEYLDKQAWPTGFYPGEPNPLVRSHVSHAYPDYETLVKAIEETTGPLQEECVRYHDWAWPHGTATSIPSPIPAPQKFDDEFGGTGLVSADGTMTLMQALEEYTDDVAGHAVAALFNCHHYGEKVFGYRPEGLKAFIRDSDPGELLANLRALNNR